MTEPSHAEFARFVQEAREQRERAERLEGETASLTEQLRIATVQLDAFVLQGKERYPGEMGTFAHDALIQMSVAEYQPLSDGAES